jgi:hydroxymethylbilane synthase
MFLPAVSQGALIIEAREHDTQTLQLLSALNDEETRITVQAERAFLHRLEGGCQVPIAAYAQLQGENVFLRGLVGSLDGKTIIRGERTGPANDPKAVGVDLAEELIGRGADTILADLRTSC